MRRASVGHKSGPSIGVLDEVVLRNKAPPAIGPGFMRRSCTFVTEGSWRKSSFGIGTAQKETKDRLNLALQVRKKAAELGTCEDEEERDQVSNGLNGSHVRSSGRVSRLVGNLRSWSSSEDVRQTVVGALTRTVNVIKHRPVSKKTKPGLTKTVSSGTATFSQPIIPSTARTKMGPPNNNVVVKSKWVPPSAKPIKAGNPAATKKQMLKNKTPLEKGIQPPSSVAPSDNSQDSKKDFGSKDKRWLRHLHEAQASYNAREGRNRRQPPSPHIPDPDDSTASADLRDVDDGVDGENSEPVDANSDCLSSRVKQDGLDASFSVPTSTNPYSSAPQTPSSPESLSKKSESGSMTSSNVGVAGSPQSPQSAPPSRSRRLQEVQIIQIVEGPSLIQPSEVKVSQGVVLSAEPVLTPIELLRRKDLKIRQELEEKQNLIADILNIPRQHFESVADMAGEVGLSNKEPRELVLGAIYQAKKLQEALNEAQTIRDSDVIAAQACTDPSAKLSTLPLYQGPMEKLLCISGTLTQLLNSLMSLVSERDEERDRMRKELVASRERVHQLHMQQNQTDSSIAGDCVMSPASQFSSSTTNPIIVDRISPHSSRPSSYVSVSSSAADQSDNTDHPVTDEEGRCDDRIPSITESQTAVGSSSEPSEVTTEGESGSPNHLKGEDDKLPSTAEEEESEAPPTLPEDSGSAT